MQCGGCDLAKITFCGRTPIGLCCARNEKQSLTSLTLAQLLEICEAYAVAHGLEYHPKKSEVMVFETDKIEPYFVPPDALNNIPMNFKE